MSRDEWIEHVYFSTGTRSLKGKALRRDRGTEFGKRNASTGEYLVRGRITNVTVLGASPIDPSPPVAPSSPVPT